jgi:hypothetical protein
MGFDLTFGTAITHMDNDKIIQINLQVQNLLSYVETQRELTQKLHKTIEILERRISSLEMDHYGWTADNG